MQHIATCLWYDGQAEEAATFYTSVIDGSEVRNVNRMPDGSVLIVEFSLGGVPFTALNGGPQFPHTEACSIQVTVDTQEDADRYWDALTADGGQESQCGWLKDRFGVSWQIVPAELGSLLAGPDPAANQRAMAEMLTQTRLDIARIRAAAARA